MQSIEEKFTEENSLQFHQQKSASTLSMEFVGRSVYMLKTPAIILLTEVTNYIKA